MVCPLAVLITIGVSSLVCCSAAEISSPEEFLERASRDEVRLGGSLEADCLADESCCGCGGSC